MTSPQRFGIRPGAWQAWRDLAGALAEVGPVPCTGDPEAFTGDDPETRAFAARACRRCPVLVECARFATANGERFGVWDRPSTRRRQAAGTDQEEDSVTRTSAEAAEALPPPGQHDAGCTEPGWAVQARILDSGPLLARCRGCSAVRVHRPQGRNR